MSFGILMELGVAFVHHADNTHEYCEFPYTKLHEFYSTIHDELEMRLNVSRFNGLGFNEVNVQILHIASNHQTCVHVYGLLIYLQSGVCHCYLLSFSLLFCTHVELCTLMHTLILWQVIPFVHM